MPSDPPCAFLPWDSEFFGRRIARVTAAPSARDETAAVLDWARAERIECLYLLVDAADGAGIRSAEDAGFRLVDLRVTLAREADAGGAPEPARADAVRAYAPGDLPALRRIARESHRDSRFYADDHFPKALCDRLYERWIERRCAEDPDAVLVACRDGEPCGYLTCQLGSDDTGQIDLIAVDAAARGKGLGAQLVGASLRWFADAGRRRTLVVTQGRNRAALALYGGLGFTARTFELWYHLWPADLAPRDAP